MVKLMLNKIKTKSWWLIAFGLLLWLIFHLPSIQYGASNLPLYVAHIGDEQVPVNGALHVLNEKNVLALRDANKAYYGPVMVMLAVPAVVLDFSRVFLFKGVSTPLEYRNYVVWNWGGILIFGRILSVLVGFVGLVIFFKILLLPEINPKRYLWPALLATALLATEYFYFHYTAQFRHWVFLNVILLSQIYLYILLKRGSFQSRWYWFLQAILTVTTFGMSYLGALFNLVWTTDLIKWVRDYKKNKTELFNFSVYTGAVLLGSALMIAWHPYAFFRMFGIVSSDLVKNTESAVLEEDYGTGSSFAYYADLFLNNHWGLVLAGAALLLLLWSFRKQLNIFSYVHTPVIILLTAYILLFGLQSHHSTHYFLPAIVMIHLLVGMCFVRLSNEKPVRQTVLWTAIIIFFGVQFSFNGLVMSKLLVTLEDGPPELALAEKLITLQEEEEGRVLLSGCSPLGVPHTREAYEDFADRAERYKTNLYSTMLADDFPFPKNVTLLDAYYDDNMPAEERLNSAQYERVVVCDVFNAENNPNKRLIFETNLMNYWRREPYLTRYILKTENGEDEVIEEGINYVK